MQEKITLGARARVFYGPAIYNTLAVASKGPSLFRDECVNQNTNYTRRKSNPKISPEEKRPFYLDELSTFSGGTEYTCDIYYPSKKKRKVR